MMDRFCMLLYVFLIIILTASCNTESVESRIVEIELPNPEEATILIQNNGNRSATFSVKVNHSFFFSGKDVIEFINQQQSYKDSPDYYKAWEFVHEYILDDYPLSTDADYSPILLLNSVGFGICDDQACLLSQIWTWMGYESRIWKLEGHVVSEVKIDGHWMMFDPKCGIYYYNNEGRIAGVEELAKQPDLITKPIQPIADTNESFSSFFLYNKKVAGLYSSTSNNTIIELPNDISHCENSDITLPPGSTFEFPAKFSNGLRVSEGRKTFNYANARLIIKRGSVGTIKMPFVIHNIIGKGMLKLNGITYRIGADSLNRIVDAKHEQCAELELIHCADDLEVIYLVNPAIKLEHINTVQLKGNNLSALDVMAGKIIPQNKVLIVTKNEAYSIPDYRNKLRIADSIVTPVAIDESLLVRNILTYLEEVNIYENGESIDSVWLGSRVHDILNRIQHDKLSNFLIDVSQPERFVVLAELVCKGSEEKIFMFTTRYNRYLNN